MCRDYPTAYILRNSITLALATAAKSFCRELSEKTKVEIVFRDEGIPHTLSKEVSLCLFRVLQEGLQNAVKHSGVRSFTVDLQGTEESIELTVATLEVALKNKTLHSPRSGLDQHARKVAIGAAARFPSNRNLALALRSTLAFR